MDKLKKISIISFAIFVLSMVISNTVAATNPYGSDFNPAIFAGFGALVLGLIIVSFIIGILLAIWVYRDAEKRGGSSVLWLLIVLITGIIGLIIWLVVRPPIGGKPKQQSDQGRMCPSCGRNIPMDAQVCPYCGKDFRPPIK
jgi:hypothetical protein